MPQTIEVSPLLIALVAASIVGWNAAIAGWVAFFLERDRRRSAEKSGRYRMKARHVPGDSAERRARSAVKKQETAAVQRLADELQAEARASGVKASREELVAEARRMLMNAGTGVPQ